MTKLHCHSNAWMTAPRSKCSQLHNNASTRPPRPLRLCLGTGTLCECSGAAWRPQNASVGRCPLACRSGEGVGGEGQARPNGEHLLCMGSLHGFFDILTPACYHPERLHAAIAQELIRPASGTPVPVAPRDFMDAWYALYTKPRCEAQVVRALAVRGIAAFLPLLPDRQTGRSKPFFPCYLFARCDLASVGLTTLNWVPGLRRILSFAGRPVIVPDKAVDLIESGLQQIEAQGGLPGHPFKPGDEVVIEAGPLAGLRAVFQGPLGPAERVRILVSFLGEANRAEVPIEILRPLSEADQFRMKRRGTRGIGRRVRYQN